MSTDAPNDSAENKVIAEKLKTMISKAEQQPISYKPLFDEAIELAEAQFRRAMIAERALYLARRCDHWPGQKRCEICGMGIRPGERINGA